MNSGELKSSRIFWVDLIRVISVFLVVEIHASALLLEPWGKNPFRHEVPLSWFVPAEAWAALARMSVPLLFMVSGYLSLSSNEPTGVFIRKRVWKVLVPLLAWSVISLWLSGFYRDLTSPLSTLKATLRAILEGNVYYTLWFLYVLVGLYMVTPLFRLIARHATQNELRYLIFLWGMTTVSYSLGQFKGWQFNLFSPPYFAGFAGYFFLGYVLGREKHPRWSVWLSALLLPLTLTGMVYWIYRMADQGRIDTELIFDFLSLQTAILTIAGFILLKELGTACGEKISPSRKELVAFFSKTSFGIFLIHDLIVLEVMGQRSFYLTGNLRTLSPFISIPLITGIAFLASAVTVFILQKIPVLKNLVPS